MDLIAFFKKHNLEWQHKTFVLAVSAGIDSSVMLELFLRLYRHEEIKIIVCHVNHHRRPQAEEEAAYLCGYCLEKGIPFYRKDLFFAIGKGNFQAEARKRRKIFFEEIILKEKADYLVTAHHADDNLETVLLRLGRGSSLAGYAGISPVREIKKQGFSYLLIRPMIDDTKEEIKDFQTKNNIVYYEDESNSSLDYTRNRIRHLAIPILREEFPDLAAKARSFGEDLAAAARIVEEKRDLFINSNVKRREEGFSFSKEVFLKNDRFMQIEILFELLKKYHLGKANVKELLKIIGSGKVNYECFFKKMFVFRITYDLIEVLKPITTKQGSENIEIMITGPGIYRINDKKVLNVTKNDSENITNLNEMCYNIDGLPLFVRTRRDGDRIRLKGGTKKVNDLFIDLKMSRKQRDEALLVADGKGEILMIFGIRKSETLLQKQKKGIVIKSEDK